MAAAARRSGREPGTVTLIGVVKAIPIELTREAAALGLADLGENRVQEAERVVAVVGRDATRWHMIGHLQSNKAARAVLLFDRIHSVDDLALAERISRQAVAAGRRMPVMVEVNVSGEASKFGVAPEDAERLIAGMLALPGLALDGLMTVGQPVERADDARPGFARLRELRDGIARRLGCALPELSMGMSADFEAAIEEGATMVRVGGALFGPRG